MQIKDYLNEILDTIASSPYIDSQNLSFEERAPNAVYINGMCVFINGSRLYFKEFIIFKSESINFLKYGYNYVDKDNILIFRYDNALDPHVKKLSTYPEHKHQPDRLLPAKRPALEGVLREIAHLIERNAER